MISMIGKILLLFLTGESQSHMVKLRAVLKLVVNFRAYITASVVLVKKRGVVLTFNAEHPEQQQSFGPGLDAN